MTPKQIKSLISAGVFSAALLSGTAYAKKKAKTEPPAQTKEQKDSKEGLLASTTNQTAVPAAAEGAYEQKTSTKDTAQTGCSGVGGCGAH